MEVEEAIKFVAVAAFFVVVLIVAIHFFIFIALPVGIVVGGGTLGYSIYAYRRDHPDSQVKRLRRRAAELEDEIGSIPTTEELAQEVGIPEFYPVIEELYGGDAMPERPPNSANAIDWGRYVDRLSSFASRASIIKLTQDAVRQSLSRFAQHLPRLPEGEFSTSIANAITNVGEAIQDTILPFFDHDVIEAGAFKSLRDQLNRNLCDMSGLPYDQHDSTKVVLPSKHKGDSQTLVSGYLRNTPFERLFECPLYFGIPPEIRFEGTHVLAPQGRGKTTLLAQILKHDLDLVAAGLASVIILDSKGELTDGTRRLECFAPGGDLEGKLVSIEPQPTLALNPLDIGSSAAHTIGLIEYVFGALLDNAPTPNQATLLQKVLLAGRTIPNCTLRTIKDILFHGKLPPEADLSQLHEEDREFFERGMMNVGDYRENRPRIAARIENMTTKVPLIRDMFRAPTTKINMGKEMDAGRVIVIDNSKKILGEGVEFFSRFFVALIRHAGEQRAGKKQKLPTFVYIDECDDVIKNDPNIAEIIQRLRSQNIGLILSHQGFSQIVNERVKHALFDCAVRIANTDAESKVMAESLRTTQERLRNLHKGQFAFYMRDYTRTALFADVPNDPISKWAKMKDAEYEAIRADMTARYCYTPKPPPPPPEPEAEPIIDDAAG